MHLEGVLDSNQILLDQRKEKGKICNTQEAEIISLKEALEKISKAAPNEEFEEELSELRRENQSLKEQMQKTQDVNQNSRRQMAHSIEEIEKTMNKQMTQPKEREEEVERLKTKVASLKEKLERTATTNLKFEKSTMILDEILSHQRSPFDKTGIGYDKSLKNLKEGESSKLPEKEVEKKPKSHTFNHDEENSKRKVHDHQRPALRRSTLQRGPFFPKYQSVFPGTCYFCNNFGHKVVNCRAFANNNRMFHNSSKAKLVRHERNHNSFGFLKLDLECFKCHNLGHKAKDSRIKSVLAQGHLPKFCEEVICYK